MRFNANMKVKQIVEHFAGNRGPCEKTIRTMVSEMADCWSHRWAAATRLKVLRGAGQRRVDSKMSEGLIAAVRAVLRKNPSLYIQEIKEQLASEYKIKTSESTVFRVIYGKKKDGMLGYSRKTLQVLPLPSAPP